MSDKREKLNKLLEQIKELGEEEQQIIRGELGTKEPKLELDPPTFQTVREVIQAVVQFLERNKPVGMENLEKKDLNSDLKIGFRLYSRRKTDITGQTTKDLQIWWKDKGKLKDFRVGDIREKNN